MITKANEHFDFNFVKFYDVDEIGYYINQFKSQWFNNTSRQETHSVHKNTKSYFIYEYNNGSFNNNLNERKLVCEDTKLLDLVMPIIKELELIYDGTVAKALFINLPGHEEVSPHADYGDYVGIIRRLHIPIITNSDVKFNVNGEIKYLKHGECWEINNNKTHHVINKSDEDRIHLMIDIVPNKFLDN